jgi:putative pre-16S rRNA nuclease
MRGERTLLGFDFGEKRIGIAVGQELTASSSPLATIHAKAGVPDWTTIAEYIDEWHPDGLVVGIPFNMDGSEHTMTQRARSFARQLEEHYVLPVFTVDERLSSIEAERMLINSGKKSRSHKHKKQLVDQIAAQLILDTYFSQNGGPHNNKMAEFSD